MERRLLEQIKEQNLLIEKLLREKHMIFKANKRIKKNMKHKISHRSNMLQFRDYVVKTILDHRQLDDGKFEFFVEWENVDNETGIRNWVPEQESYKEKIEEYFNNL